MEIEDIKKLISLESEIITETPVVFDITVEDPSMLPDNVKIDKISIYPLKVRTVNKISPLILGRPGKGDSQ